MPKSPNVIVFPTDFTASSRAVPQPPLRVGLDRTGEFGDPGFGDIGGVSEHQHGSLLPGELGERLPTAALIA